MKRGGNKIIQTYLFTVGLAAAVLFCFAAPQAAHALQAGDIGILPANPDPAVKYSDSWLIFSLKPGETKQDAVKIFNRGDETAAVKLYPVDAVTTSDGTFAPLEEYAERSGVGKWITVDQYRLDLPAHSEVTIPLTITIPEGVDVGDHAGAVIMERINRTIPKAGQSGVEIVTRVGIRVFETVPGTITQRLAIQKLDWKFQDIPLSSNASKLQEVWYNVKRFIGLERTLVFNIHLENQGNVRLEPTGTVSVKNLWGKQVGVFDPGKYADYLRPNELGLILPGKQTTVPLRWDQAISLFNRFRVNVTITYGDGLAPATASVQLWIIPYNLFGIIFILLFLAVLITYTHHVVVISEKLRLPKHKVLPGENLVSIAQQFGITLKQLSKVNELRPDAVLPAGLVIALPEGNLSWRVIRRTLMNPVTVLLALLVLLVAGDAYFYFNYYHPQRLARSAQPVNSVFFQGENKALTQQVAIEHDTERKLDLATLRDALEKYYRDSTKYPATAGKVVRTYETNSVLQVELVDKHYLTKLPLDPLDPRFDYRYYSDGQTYELTSILENEQDAQSQLIGSFHIYRFVSPPHGQ